MIMNKKIVACLFSFFSMTLVGAEEQLKMKASRKREQAETLQNNRTKRIKKRQNQEQAGGMKIEITESKIFSFENLKEILEEMNGSSVSQEEIEQNIKGSHYKQEIELVDKHLYDLRNRIIKFQENFNLHLLSIGEVDPEDGDNIIILGRALQASGEENGGKELETIGLEILLWKPRREQAWNNLVGGFYGGPQFLDTD